MANVQAWFKKLLIPYYLLNKRANDGYQFLPKPATLGKKFHFLNIGYWSYQADYDKATTELALKLANLAQLASGDIVLSVGCGFGEEVILWSAQYQPAYLVGLNLCLTQLPAGTRENNNYAFIQANAISLPFVAHTFTKILALESAFHFDSRAVFFQQAFTCLKPAGQLCLADIIIKSQSYNLLQKGILRLACKIAKIPVANQHDRQTYLTQLAQAGFEIISYQDVSKKVLNGFLIFMNKAYQKNQFHYSSFFKFLVIFKFILKWVFPRELPISYVLIKAQKPVKVYSASLTDKA